MNKSIQALLTCPACHKKLHVSDSQLACSNSGCAVIYPVVNGVPILINEQASIFSIDDIVSSQKAVAAKSADKMARLSDATRFIPNPNRNVGARKNNATFLDCLLQSNPNPRVLVLGGGTVGEGMEVLIQSQPPVELIETDIYFGPRTMIICDAHDIPFPDNSLDGVIVQAVLEHVVDPAKCASEIHRILKPGQGIVYAETPFMQQVHMGRYDFTRFTHLGHRRLFRKFEEIDSGAACGPGMALAWAYEYFLLSFAETAFLRKTAKAFARFTGFWLKYFDTFLINKPGTMDAASSYYFIGRKTDKTISDKELIQQYRGALKVD